MTQTPTPATQAPRPDPIAIARKYQRELTERAIASSPNSKPEAVAAMVDDWIPRTISIWRVTESAFEYTIGLIWLTSEIDREGNKAAHVFLLHVDTDRRRRGVGRQLLQAAEQRAIEDGYPRITLSVDPENEAAIALYKSCGFLPNTMIMSKSLIQS
jgi:ribosomal protein S18 acetylase RimI-like enzyme